MSSLGTIKAQPSDDQVGPSLDGRLSPRVAVNIPVELEVVGAPRPIHAHCRDIGTGGACVATSCVFPSEALRSIAIRFPSGSLKLQSTVRWQRIEREDEEEQAILTGVEFREVPRETLFLLWRLIHDRAQEIACFLHGCESLSALDLEDKLQIALFSRLRQIGDGSLIHLSEEAPGFCSLFILFRGTATFQIPVGLRPDFKDQPLRQGAIFGGVGPGPGNAIATSDALLLELDAFALKYLQVARPLVERRLAHCAVAAAIARFRMFFRGLDHASSWAVPSMPQVETDESQPVERIVEESAGKCDE